MYEQPFSDVPALQNVDEGRDTMAEITHELQAQLEPINTQLLASHPTAYADRHPLAVALEDVYQSLGCFRDDLRTKNIAHVYRHYFDIIEIASQHQKVLPFATTIIETFRNHDAFAHLRGLSSEHWDAEIRAISSALISESGSQQVAALLTNSQSLEPLLTARTKIQILLNTLRDNCGRLNKGLSDAQWELEVMRFNAFRNDTKHIGELTEPIRAELEIADAIEQPTNFLSDESPFEIALSILWLNIETRAILASKEMEL